MADVVNHGTGIDAGPSRVWYATSTPTEIHLTFDNPQFHSPKTGPGMRVTFSSNPKSANYHPANFNRCVRALQAQGLPAPDAVDEHDRRLDKRNVIFRPKSVVIDGVTYISIDTAVKGAQAIHEMLDYK